LSLWLLSNALGVACFRLGLPTSWWVPPMYITLAKKALVVVSAAAVLCISYHQLSSPSSFLLLLAWDQLMPSVVSSPSFLGIRSLSCKLICWVGGPTAFPAGTQQSPNKARPSSPPGLRAWPEAPSSPPTSLPHPPAEQANGTAADSESRRSPGERSPLGYEQLLVYI
jgi:hypothetical protein